MACSNASDEVTAIASPTKAPKLHSCSSCSTKRVCGPLAKSLFHHWPDEAFKPPASKVETATTRPIMPSNTSSTGLLPENCAR